MLFNLHSRVLENTLIRISLSKSYFLSIFSSQTHFYLHHQRVNLRKIIKNYQAYKQLPYSLLNSTTKPLGDNTTFTGKWEDNNKNNVGVYCKSDTSGILYFEFSDNQRNLTRINRYPITGFKITPGINNFYTSIKISRFFRIKFINEFGTQSHFKLYTYYQ